SVITSISLEHTEILGTTLEAIAQEKAGIIKPHTPVVIGPHVPREIIASIAQELHAPLSLVEGEYPTFHEENRAIAERALQLLDVRESAIQMGLKALPPCRMETHTLQGKPLIFDVAHNPDGLQRLFTSLKVHYPRSSLRIICGLSKNKDISTCA